MSDEEDEKDDPQKSLFGGRGYARNSDPETSKIAAAKVKVARLEKKVVRFHIEVGEPYTMKEACLTNDWDPGTYQPRYAPLRRKGILFNTGRKRKNPGSTREGILWDVTDLGRRIMAELES